MVEISVEGHRVVFTVQGLDKLWSLRSRLEIPVAHITGVDADAVQVGRWWHGVRLMGTQVPGVLAAGTFYYHGEMVFWDVHDPARTIVVSLAHEHYRKLIIDVADPPRAMALLRSAIGA